MRCFISIVLLSIALALPGCNSRPYIKTVNEWRKNYQGVILEESKFPFAHKQTKELGTIKAWEIDCMDGSIEIMAIEQDDGRFAIY